MEHRIMVRVTEQLHKAVKIKAVEVGRPMSEIIRDLLTLWIEGKVSLPDKEGST